MSSKSHRLPYSKSSHQTNKALEIIHSDLWGPSLVISHVVNRYYVMFIDDFTRYTWLYPLKLKSDVFQDFIDFQHRIERQFNQKIVNFQSDWGGEFQALSKHLKEHGINHRISCPHTPAQNGTAERKHRHIIETALSLLHQSSVPNSFWDEVVCTAVYLINRLPTQILKKKSPYQLVYNKEPEYGSLKNFGCTCYPCLRPYTTSKLDSRSERCVFLSYSAFHSGYRCLSLTSGKLYISRDGVFIENTYPYKEQLQQAPISNSNSQLSLGLIGPSPTNTNPTCITQVISSPKPISPVTTKQSQISITMQEAQSPLQQTPTHNSTNYTHNSTDSSPNSTDFNHNVSPTRHIPSADPLSPSNLDSSNTKTHVKTRRLSDIIRRVDSGDSTQTTKFPLPTCLHTTTSASPDPINFSTAIA